jgi:hypothetical protein
MARALTDLAVQHIKPGLVRREIPDPGQRGLYLVIHPTGNKSFCVRYRLLRQAEKTHPDARRWLSGGAQDRG